jgi:ribosomal protein S18 acetylase RimI-like enzyme
MSFTFERITIEQIDDIVSLFDKYMVFYEQESNPKKYLVYLESRIRNDEAIIFLAYDENENAIGFVLNYICFSSVSLGKIVILNDLFVSSEFRKEGIGNKLIDCSIDLAKQIGAVRVDLGTAKDNHRAQGLYEKIGFVKDDDYFSYSFAVKRMIN